MERKVRPKVVAATAAPLVGAVIVFVAAQLGVDVPEEVALGMAAAALLAFGGGYSKKESPGV